MSRTNPSVPAPHDLVRWQPLDASNLSDLYRLLRASETEDKALFGTSLGEAQEMLSRPFESRIIGAYLSGDAAVDDLVGFAYVGLASSGKRECVCHGGVHPSHRMKGIGSELLRWQTTVGADLIHEKFPGRSGRIVHSVDARQSAFYGHLESLGYQWRRSYVELRHDLVSILDAPKLPHLIEIVSWSNEWEEVARRAYNRAAAEIGQAEGQTSQQWTEARAHLAPEWSFIAIDKSTDRAKVVGLVEVGRYEQDWRALGWTEGYIDTVAVFEASLRQSLQPLLLQTAMKAIRGSGVDKAAVGLDPEEDQEMFDFYTSIGFEQHALWRTYTLKVSALKEIDQPSA